MSGIQFTPGRKGNLSRLLRKLYYCQSKPITVPFTGTGFTYTLENPISNCNIYENCACIQEKVNQIKTGYNDPIQPQNLRVSQLITQSVGGRTTFGNIGLGLGRGANARTFNTYLGGIEGQPGGSPRPIRNRF
jgi:hypothetical protein